MDTILNLKSALSLWHFIQLLQCHLHPGAAPQPFIQREVARVFRMAQDVIGVTQD